LLRWLPVVDPGSRVNLPQDDDGFKPKLANPTLYSIALRRVISEDAAPVGQSRRCFHRNPR
jgi:hypothetical protein